MALKMGRFLIVALLLFMLPVKVAAWQQDQEGEITVQGPPNPVITSVTFDKSSYQFGEWIQISISARNDGPDGEMYLSVSLPDNPSSSRIAIVSGFNDPGIHLPGKTVNSNYGQSTTVLAYPLIEDYLGSWPTGATKTLVVRVRPEAPGISTFYVKAVAYGAGQWTFDPTSGTRDQQNEFVKVYTRPSYSNIQVSTFSVTINPGEVKDTSFRITNNNLEAIVMNSFQILDYGGFTSSRGKITLQSSLPVTINPGSYRDIVLRVEAYQSCPAGTYTIDFRVVGTP